MKYRGSVEIRGQILQVANGFNATKTKIMNQAFMSYNQLEEHLFFLIEKGLLRYDGILEHLEPLKRVYNFFKSITT